MAQTAEAPGDGPAKENTVRLVATQSISVQDGRNEVGRIQPDGTTDFHFIVGCTTVPVPAKHLGGIAAALRQAAAASRDKEAAATFKPVSVNGFNISLAGSRETVRGHAEGYGSQMWTPEQAEGVAEAFERAQAAALPDIIAAVPAEATERADAALEVLRGVAAQITGFVGSVEEALTAAKASAKPAGGEGAEGAATKA